MEEPAGGVMDCCGEDGAEPQGKVLDSPVDPHFSLTYSHKLDVVTETMTARSVKPINCQICK